MHIGVALVCKSTPKYLFPTTNNLSAAKVLLHLEEHPTKPTQQRGPPVAVASTSDNLRACMHGRSVVVSDVAVTGSSHDDHLGYHRFAFAI